MSSSTKNQLLKFAFFLLFALGPNTTQAQEHEEPKKPFKRHAINFCPAGMAFGIFSANYEYLITPKNGIVVRLDYEAIPKTYTAATIESNGKAFILNYRRHFSGEMNSFYAGAYTRYRLYKGEGEINAQKFDFKIPEVTIGLNIGKRWVWKSGFNLNLAFGYGISFKDKKTSLNNMAVNTAVDSWEDSYDFINPFLGEFSIGYSF
ncbi:DUF3575 domain-containing protein [Flavobacterium sp. NRK F10]|uniref:DUF3575 domain-containing protein n=1 Tax=Flavobacterium sp. NRK F10 TaxID=2954931 RepID=UPI00209056B4|nr:DUF3575 domain-containing protein [Flavobacterium sp. NRK F10]MCO6173421.1 DUF3575 domain-containing protein [Flavobacterium sp. NRK F10]